MIVLVRDDDDDDVLVVVCYVPSSPFPYLQASVTNSWMSCLNSDTRLRLLMVSDDGDTSHPVILDYIHL